MKHNIHRPRTLILPPAPYAAAILAGWWMDRNIRALHWGWNTTTQPFGWLCIFLGLLLLTWTAITLWYHRTTVNPYKAASNLCTTGPFHYSRNPIYLGDWLIFIGASILLSTWWPLLFTPLIWAILRYGVIRHEEAHLEARFGDAYLDYKTRVRRWL
ncbi:isoprenylcysteine carboxylmethyltransferase family protein [Nitrosomonas sp. HPC101]|uniref:methyltransferase family protein n=1 Tax=Nitrosomonas sp. HPC101 TaxID=1658667 RepID=UPI00137141BF|nr:isoprenylcysteine carboxylmethyltransferase family protein [Nitrosomonas sp. HPC101]MXS84658.1 isoprenylcysteine carboxylmethyltransferase family protein [Nitrosomonas sp. HPC101]